MTPFVTMNTSRDSTTVASDKANANAAHSAKPDLSYLPTFNVAGGRPDERCGTHGSFTRGVRIMSGGPAREMPLEADVVDHGKVLFVSSTLKPDLSGEARTNTAAGRPTERLGSSRFTPGAKTFRGGAPRDVPLEAEILDHGKVLFVSSTLKPDLSGEARTNTAAGRPTERLGSSRFTPGAKTFRGGAPRDIPLEAEILDHGKVLFVSSTLKPDLSGEARTNAVRPTERLGSRGRFTPGARRWLGGQPRDVPLAPLCDPGTVIFESPKLAQQDLSAVVAKETNVAGGRPAERRGVHGSFTPGVRIMSGGAAREMPLEADVFDHGKVLFMSSTPKPNLSGEAHTNIAGGRPDERLGSSRSTPGARCWLGGEPRDTPAGRETIDHGNIIVPRPPQVESSSVGGGARGDCDLTGNDNDEGNGGAWFFETEDIAMDESCQVLDAALAWEKTTTATVRMNGTCSFDNLAERAGGGVFRRCGSDSQFNAGADLMKDLCRPSF